MEGKLELLKSIDLGDCPDLTPKSIASFTVNFFLNLFHLPFSAQDNENFKEFFCLFVAVVFACADYPKVITKTGFTLYFSATT